MKALAILAVAMFVAVGSASANGGPIGPPHKEDSHKTWICHNGRTLSVDYHALKGHLGHGDKLGKCKPSTPPGNGGGTPNPTGGDTPVTPATFAQVNRILACADRPVLRVADKTMGIAVDLTVEIFNSGVYGTAKFTVARWYAGVGATCDNLGGSPNGKLADGPYPVWVR